MSSEPSLSELIVDKATVKHLAIFIATCVGLGLASAAVQVVFEEIKENRKQTNLK